MIRRNFSSEGALKVIENAIANKGSEATAKELTGLQKKFTKYVIVPLAAIGVGSIAYSKLRNEGKACKKKLNELTNLQAQIAELEAKIQNQTNDIQQSMDEIKGAASGVSGANSSRVGRMEYSASDDIKVIGERGKEFFGKALYKIPESINGDFKRWIFLLSTGTILGAISAYGLHKAHKKFLGIKKKQNDLRIQIDLYKKLLKSKNQRVEELNEQLKDMAVLVSNTGGNGRGS